MLARDPAKADRVLASKQLKPGDVEVVAGDMLDDTVVESAAAGCDATIHCAAAIRLTPQSRGSLIVQNVQGARNVVTAALRSGHDPIVHVSSVSIFRPLPGGVITASTPISAPHSEYARSKIETEKELRGLQGRGESVTILYPGAIIGPDVPLVDATVEALLCGRKQRWPVTSGGTPLLDVRDLASALVATLVPGRGPRNLVLGGHFFRWGDLGDILDEVTGVRAKRLRVPRTLILSAGATLDLVRSFRPVAYPLSLEGARIMTTMVPTDDGPTLKELGIALRPPRETLEATFRWLTAAGHFDRGSRRDWPDVKSRYESGSVHAVEQHGSKHPRWES